MKMAWTGCNMDGQRREGILQIKQKINLQTIQRKSGWGSRTTTTNIQTKKGAVRGAIDKSTQTKIPNAPEPQTHLNIQKHDVRNEDSVRDINKSQERKNWLFAFKYIYNLLNLQINDT